MRVKYNIFLFSVFLLNFNVYSQKGFINFEQVRVENIASIENSFDSKVYESKFEHLESKKDSIVRYGKLKCYSRPENKYFGKVNVRYYFLKEESVVQKITYSWNSPKNSTLKDYSKQFDKTVKEISTELDLPIGEQGKLSKILDETVEGISVELTQRKVIWEYNEAKIIVIMIWSEKYGAYLNTEIEWRI